MKDQLQLQEIAGYLPYSLRIETKYGIDNLIGIMFSDDTDYNSTKKTTHNVNHPLANTDTHCLEFYEIKPILRPCTESELSKTLCINDKKDKFIDYISTSIKDSQFNMRMLISGKSDSLEYWKIQRLLQWHFDIHNLIGRGLAININDLPPIKD